VGVNLQAVSDETDLGVILTDNVKVSKQCSKAAKKERKSNTENDIKDDKM